MELTGQAMESALLAQDVMLLRGMDPYGLQQELRVLAVQSYTVMMELYGIHRCILEHLFHKVYLLLGTDPDGL